MEPLLAVFRVVNKEGKYRYGYTWLKKRGRVRSLSTVSKKLNKDSNEEVVNIWSVSWRDDPIVYQIELGDMKEPEHNFVSMVRGNVNWKRRGSGWSERKKSESKPEFQQKYYKLSVAPVN